MSLWTSITKGIRSTLKSVAAPVVSGLIGGPVGAVVATGIGGSSSGISYIKEPPSTYSGPGGIPKPGLEGTVERTLPFGETGYYDPRKYKVGRLTGNTIPRGYVERMSKDGVIYLARPRRRRGITARDLATYRRVSRVLKTYARTTTRRRS